MFCKILFFKYLQIICKIDSKAKAFIGSSGHQMDFDLLYLAEPIHIPSVFSGLVFGPNIFSMISNILWSVVGKLEKPCFLLTNDNSFNLRIMPDGDTYVEYQHSISSARTERDNVAKAHLVAHHT